MAEKVTAEKRREIALNVKRARWSIHQIELQQETHSERKAKWKF
jgi:hypothetical protein